MTNFVKDVGFHEVHESDFGGLLLRYAQTLTMKTQLAYFSLLIEKKLTQKKMT